MLTPEQEEYLIENVEPNELLQKLREKLVDANIYYGQTGPITEIYDMFEKLDLCMRCGRVPNEWLDDGLSYI